MQNRLKSVKFLLLISIKSTNLIGRYKKTPNINNIFSLSFPHAPAISLTAKFQHCSMRQYMHEAVLLGYCSFA